MGIPHLKEDPTTPNPTKGQQPVRLLLLLPTSIRKGMKGGGENKNETVEKFYVDNLG